MCAGVNIEEMAKSRTSPEQAPTTASAPTRGRSYHHGDLRNALIRAAAGLAETGGPEAVTVRAAARTVGVTPTAAYRHFGNHEELLVAAHHQAQSSLFEAIQEALTALPPEAAGVDRLSAAGQGYITFALREPGLFRTAFCVPESHAAEHPDDKGHIDAPAYLVLSEILDGLVAEGYTDPTDRADAEIGAWSAVHGLAALLVDGALGKVDDAARATLIEQTLELVRRGLATGPQAGR